jgi:hypothetical protein
MRSCSGSGGELRAAPRKAHHPEKLTTEARRAQRDTEPPRTSQQLIHHEGTKDTKGTKNNNNKTKKMLWTPMHADASESFVPFVPSW